MGPPRKTGRWLPRRKPAPSAVPHEKSLLRSTAEPRFGPASRVGKTIRTPLSQGTVL